MKYVGIIGPYRNFVNYIHSLSKRVSINKHIAVDEESNITYIHITDMMMIRGTEFHDIHAVYVKSEEHIYGSLYVEALERVK